MINVLISTALKHFIFVTIIFSKVICLFFLGLIFIFLFSNSSQTPAPSAQ